MSTVKSKKLQVGTDASASNNFTIYQPASPDGTLRIGVGNADSPTEVGRFDSNGYVATNAPAFSAYASGAQSMSNATYTKVSYSAEEFDTASCYDTSLSRFTPNVEGYYQVSANIVVEGVGAGAETISILYKNGATWNWGTDFDFKSGQYYGHTVTSLIYLNGTTDYIEIYFRQSSGSSTNVNPNGIFPSRFGAFLARAV